MVLNSRTPIRGGPRNGTYYSLWLCYYYEANYCCWVRGVCVGTGKGADRNRDWGQGPPGSKVWDWDGYVNRERWKGWAT
jgi:hypothetical protein